MCSIACAHSLRTPRRCAVVMQKKSGRERKERERALKNSKIPESVIRRLPLYLRNLEQLRDRQVDTISSASLAQELDANPAQIRKDLAYFGEFGQKGIGYNVPYLTSKIRDILNLNQPLRVALVGAGRLGMALCHYNSNLHNNVHIVAVFDTDENKWGTKVGGITVHPVAELPAVIATHMIRTAVIAVPREAAQTVTDQLVEAGVVAILNFAPTPLRVPANVRVRTTDFTSELQSLAYYTLA